MLELTYTAWDLAPFAADLWAGADERLRAALLAQHAANRAATGGHPWKPPPWACLPAQPPDDLPLAPFRWDDERRAGLRAELDAYYARLYGLSRDELRYILDPKEVQGPDFPGETFRVLKEKEERQHGEYRTRRLVLAAFDRLEAALGPAPVRDYRAELLALLLPVLISLWPRSQVTPVAKLTTGATVETATGETGVIIPAAQAQMLGVAPLDGPK